MAVLLNGMTPREVTDLTLAIAQSGEVLDMSGVVKIVVDKHSTGGVGDKTTLVVLPAVAACGLPVGKMSGRGLGFSGGTLDKLESIPGYRVDLSTEEFERQLKEIGLVLCGQSKDLAPADGKLYALRDVTGTVQSIPLIASSVMSKKIAGGAQAIVLDVKVGNGAFMTDLKDAHELADLMVKIGQLAGRKVVALISDMNQPLGCAVGNALEIREAIDTLHGGGPDDFREHCLHVAAHMLVLGEVTNSLAAGAHPGGEVGGRRFGFCEVPSVGAGAGRGRFLCGRSRQTAEGGACRGGDCASKRDPGTGPLRDVGEASVALGAGRAKKGDPVDHAVGFVIHHKVGDRVKEGEPLFTVHASDKLKLEDAIASVLAAHVIVDHPVPPLPLFYE